MNENQVGLTLTRAEALVLFELLARLETSAAVPFADPAEQRVLWRLGGQLEKLLTEPLAPDYQDLVTEARRVVRAT